MPAKHLLAESGLQQWTGVPAEKAGRVFFSKGFPIFLVHLLLMIFFEPLRNFLGLVAVCTVAATILIVSGIVSKAQREKSFLADLTSRVNRSILEITGNPKDRVSAGRLRKLIEHCGTLPLPVNGVPGVELKVEGKRFEVKRILAVVTSPDYGLRSFDLLLAAEQQRKA